MLVYEREGVQVYLGDCRDILPMLGNESIDLLVTDPPYGKDYQSGTRTKQFDRMIGDDDAFWVPSALSMSGMCLRRNRHAYIFGPAELEEFPLRHRADLVWDKMLHGSGDLASQWGSSHEKITFAIRAPDRAKANMDGGVVPARLRSGSILRYMRPNANGVKRHPTEKPVALLRRLVESSSFPGDVVLDPFVGSGSTLVAAVAEGRRAIGIEIDHQYVKISVARVDAAIDAAIALDVACK